MILRWLQSNHTVMFRVFKYDWYITIPINVYDRIKLCPKALSPHLGINNNQHRVQEYLSYAEKSLI